MRKLLTIFGIAASLLLTSCDNYVFSSDGKITVKGYVAYTDGAKTVYRYQCETEGVNTWLFIYSHEKFEIGDEIIITKKHEE